MTTSPETTRLTPMEQAMMWERMSSERLSDTERQRIMDGGEFVRPTSRTAIPIWLDVECEMLDGAPLNPLEKFILDHEPDDETGFQWRRDLRAVIEWVKQQ